MRGMNGTSRWLAAILLAGMMGGSACAPINVKVFPNSSEPLREFTLQGRATEKILVVPVCGFIAEATEDRLFYDRPGMVQEVVAQLHRAEVDDQIRAVVLKIDSPGGTCTGSDILYHELQGFQQRTGLPVVAVMMNVAASGGYMTAMAADRIVAHPTSVTGSVGVIFLRPQFSGLMDKLGVGVAVNKSGPQKDMGSPFRPSTPDEEAMFQALVDGLNRQFLALVKERRRPSEAQLQEIATARVFLGEDAVRVGLVDQIGYLDDALAVARDLAKLPKDARVVVYRRTAFADDNLYNSALSRTGGPVPLVDLGQLGELAGLRSGCYYLWMPEY